MKSSLFNKKMSLLEEMQKKHEEQMKHDETKHSSLQATIQLQAVSISASLIVTVVNQLLKFIIQYLVQYIFLEFTSYLFV